MLNHGQLLTVNCGSGFCWLQVLIIFVPQGLTMAFNSTLALQAQSTQALSSKTKSLAFALSLTEADCVVENPVHTPTNVQLVESRATQQLPAQQTKLSTPVPLHELKLQSLSHTLIKFPVLAKYLENYPKKRRIRLLCYQVLNMALD